MHNIAIRHENAIKLFFGLGVTCKVHSPVRTKRKHYKEVIVVLHNTDALHTISTRKIT